MLEMLFYIICFLGIYRLLTGKPQPTQQKKPKKYRVKEADPQAVEIYRQNLELLQTDEKKFRRLVMFQIAEDKDCSLQLAAHHYNRAKEVVDVHLILCGKDAKPRISDARDEEYRMKAVALDR